MKIESGKIDTLIGRFISVFFVATTLAFALVACGGGSGASGGSPSNPPSFYPPFGGLTSGGIVSLFAGSASGTSGSTNGTGTAALFFSPRGITSDGTNLYVADQGNNQIRKIVIATGVVTTLAGSSVVGSTDGTGTAALFSNPIGITTDGTNLYVSDTNNNQIRQIVIATGVVTTLAGSSVTAGSTNGTGTAALFNAPIGLTASGANLYVADSGNNQIRQIVIGTGVVTTLAGSAASGVANGTGAAAQFNAPGDVTSDGTNLYVTDFNNSQIRKVVISTATVSLLAGNASGVPGLTNGTGTAAQFTNPINLTTDGTNLYVADTYNNEIRQVVIATGAVSLLAGNASGVGGTTNGTGTAAMFNRPTGITKVGTSLFVSDSANNEIRRIQ